MPSYAGRDTAQPANVQRNTGFPPIPCERDRVRNQNHPYLTEIQACSGELISFIFYVEGVFCQEDFAEYCAPVVGSGRKAQPATTRLARSLRPGR